MNFKITVLVLLYFYFGNITAQVNVSEDSEIIVESKEIKKFDFEELQTYFETKDSNKTYVVNFWATWCAPCKEEMPSLDALKVNPNLNNLEIFPINIGKDNLKKSNIFFEDLNIKNLDIYFDNPVTLAKDLALRGVPTTILFNKEGKEFARIIGSIDFNEEEFLEWISSYN